jgi:hypothetical protein
MRTFVKRLIRRWCPAPESERLLAAVEAATIELERRKAGQDPAAESAGWLLAAQQNLEKARGYYADEQYQIAWREIKAAERAMLEDPKDGAGAESKAATMRREAEALEGRRGKAMLDLLCDDKGVLRPDLRNDRTRLVEAAALRDDYYDTQYYRIELRRRHLINLFFLLLIALAVLVGLSYAGMIELFGGGEPGKGSPDRLVTVILLGVLCGAQRRPDDRRERPQRQDRPSRSGLSWCGCGRRSARRRPWWVHASPGERVPQDLQSGTDPGFCRHRRDRPAGGLQRALHRRRAQPRGQSPARQGQNLI